MSSFDFRTPKGTSIPITKEVTRIGRAQDNDVVINDPSVSRYHLNIFKKNDTIVIESVETSSGYTLNGERKSTHARLNTGDKIQFGRATLFLGIIGQEIPLFQDFKKTQTTNSEFKFEANQAPNTGNQKKLIIRGVMLVAIVLLVFKLGSKEQDPEQPVEDKIDPAEINDPSFNAIEDSYKKEEPILRGAQDIIAENTFKKGRREYFDQNYVRAIIHFNKALSENPSLSIAKRYLNRAQSRYEKQLKNLLSDANTSFRIGHYSRSKSQASKVLTLLSEQIPGYIYKLSNSNRSPDGRSSRIKIQEDLLIGIPCERTTQNEICKSALDVVRRSRLELRDEEALK